MKKVVIIALAAIFFGGAVSAVQAEDINQKQSIDQSIKAKTYCYSYYGDVNCPQDNNQSATQNQTAVIGRKVHVPANTALDMAATAAIIATAFIGLGASVALRKVA